MYCPSCHAAVSPEAQFCTQCRHQILSDAPEWHDQLGDLHQRQTRPTMSSVREEEHGAFAPRVMDHEDYEIEYDPFPDEPYAQEAAPNVAPYPEQPGFPPHAPDYEQVSYEQAGHEQVSYEQAGYEDQDSHRHATDAEALLSILSREPSQSIQPDYEALDEPYDEPYNESYADEFDDGYAMDELDDSFFSDEPAAFGDEDAEFIDEDSGPIPMSASRFDELEGFDDEEEVKPRRRHRFSRRQGGDWKRRVVLQAQELADRVPRRPAIAAAALLLVIMLGFVFSGGEEPETTGGEASSSSASASVGPAAGGETPEGAVFDFVEPERELIALDEGGPEEETEVAEAVVAPVVEAQNHHAFPRSALTPETKVASSKARKLNRPCVLRKGPSSRFRAVIPQVAPGTKVIRLAKSSGEWQTFTRGDRSGWARSCKGNDCVLRQGPGQHFKRVTGKKNSVKPRSPVTSSARWSYVKIGDKYGWTGPACWKK